MARASTFELKSAYPGRVVLLCAFKPNDTSAPNLLVGDGVAKVARTGIGVYVITLDDKYYGLYASGTLNKASGAAGYLVGCVCSASAKTVTVTFTTEAGTATDVSGGTNDSCVVTIWAEQGPALS